MPWPSSLLRERSVPVFDGERRKVVIMSNGADKGRSRLGDKARVEERRLWEQLNQRLNESVRKGTLTRNAAREMGKNLTTDPELTTLFARVFEFAESGSGYIYERLQEPNPIDPFNGGHHKDDGCGFMAKILLGLETSELRCKTVDTLERGAEVLRRHYGWSNQELAQRVHLPPDWSAEYVEPTPAHVGQRVTELREIAGRTPGELALEGYLSIERLRLLEEGKLDSFPDICELQGLASVLGTNPLFLWYWAGQLASAEG